MVSTPQVRMANDIAVQFSYLPHDAAVARIAAHLRTFWDPRMRAQLLEQVDRVTLLEQGDAAEVGLDPLVVEAVQLLS